MKVLKYEINGICFDENNIVYIVNLYYHTINTKIERCYNYDNELFSINLPNEFKLKLITSLILSNNYKDLDCSEEFSFYIPINNNDVDIHLCVMQFLLLERTDSVYININNGYVFNNMFLLKSYYINDSYFNYNEFINITDYFRYNYKQMSNDYNIFLLILKYCYLNKLDCVNEIIQKHSINLDDDIFCTYDNDKNNEFIKYLTALHKIQTNELIM